MAMGLVSDKSLQDISNAINEMSGLPVQEMIYEYKDIGEVTKYSASPNVIPETGEEGPAWTVGFPNGGQSVWYRDIVHIPNASSIHITLDRLEGLSTFIYMWAGNHPNYNGNFSNLSFSGYITDKKHDFTTGPLEWDIEDEFVTIYFGSETSNYVEPGDPPGTVRGSYRAIVNGIEREITSSTKVDNPDVVKYTPSGMGDAIRALNTQVHIALNQNNLLLYDLVLDYIYRPEVTINIHPSIWKLASQGGVTENRNWCRIYGFDTTKLTGRNMIPFTIKLRPEVFTDGTPTDLDLRRIFSGMIVRFKDINVIPEQWIDEILDNGIHLCVCDSMFENNSAPQVQFEQIYRLNVNNWINDPENVLNKDTWIYLSNKSAESVGKFAKNSYIVSIDCGKLPRLFWEQGNRNDTQFVYQAFENCTSLREALNVWVPDSGGARDLTSNCFYNTFYHCYPLRRITFAPQRAERQEVISNQIIDLTTVGYDYDYTFGRPKVESDEEYAQYKDQEYVTTNKIYGYYGHNSFVETINTLPIVDSGTIKCYGDQGANTDQGGISTITDEEMAIATTRGWTIAMQ